MSDLLFSDCKTESLGRHVVFGPLVMLRIVKVVRGSIYCRKWRYFLFVCTSMGWSSAVIVNVRTKVVLVGRSATGSFWCSSFAFC